MPGECSMWSMPAEHVVWEHAWWACSVGARLLSVSCGNMPVNIIFVYTHLNALSIHEKPIEPHMLSVVIHVHPWKEVCRSTLSCHFWSASPNNSVSRFALCAWEHWHQYRLVNPGERQDFSCIWWRASGASITMPASGQSLDLFDDQVNRIC